MKIKLFIAMTLLIFGVSAQSQTISTRIVGDTFATNVVVVSKGALKVFAVTGYSASSQYIMLFATNGVPNDGLKGLMSVPVSAGQYYSIDFGYYGLDLSSLTVANSSTANTLTIGPADTTFQVIMRR